MRRRYYVLDVFTDRTPGGNPLAAVIDCDGLDTEAMQKIAADFNLSETIFVLAPRDPINTARLRIFTPRAELPFAGHPTVGGAVLVAELRAAAHLRAQDLRIVLEENIGEIVCSVSHRPNSVHRAHFILPKLPTRLGRRRRTRRGLRRRSAFRPRISASTGMCLRSIRRACPFTFVPVASLAAIASAKPRPDLFDDAFGNAAYLYTRECAESGHDFHARMFAPQLGVAEDPATGSAAAAFAGVLMAFEKIADGSHAFAIEQGYEMGRPSLIALTLDVEKSVLVEASIGGGVLFSAQGTLDT